MARRSGPILGTWHTCVLKAYLERIKAFGMSSNMEKTEKRN